MRIPGQAFDFGIGRPFHPRVRRVPSIFLQQHIYILKDLEHNDKFKAKEQNIHQDYSAVI